MKTLLSLILSALALAAQGLDDPAFVSSLTVPSAAPSGPSYLISEDCEGAGTPSGWTDANTPDWDYATSPAPLAGTQSLYMNEAADDSVYSISGIDEVWVYCIYRTTVISASPYVIYILDSSNTELAKCRFMSTGAVRAYNGASNGSSAAGVVTVDTTYHVWMYYLRGTGANSTTTVWVNTSDTLPGSATATITTGPATGAAGKVKVAHGSGSATTAIWDKIRADDVAIGSSPQ